MKVLLVDDDRLALLLLSEGMIAAGLDVVQAESGEAALERLWHESDFDAIVSDIQMPRMDGLTLAGHVRQRQHDDPNAPLARVPLLALTGSISCQADEARLLTAFDAVMSKPVSIESLVGRIHALTQAVCVQA